MSEQKIAVVTGAARGVGAATVHRLTARGFHVIAGVRKPADVDRFAQAGVEAALLDITQHADIDRLVERVENDPQGRRLGALVNNAAVALNAPAEIVPMPAWRSNFETNFFGHVALTSALTPALVRSGDSRIVNVSSMAAVLAGPSFGPYAVAKAALETYSDILRRELARTGVRVIVVQPAAIKTDGWAEGAAATNEHTSTMNSEQHERYGGLLHAVAETSAKWSSGGVSAATAAEVIVAAIARSTPKPRYGVGRGTRITAMLTRLLSDRTMDRMLNRMLNLK